MRHACLLRLACLSLCFAACNGSATPAKNNSASPEAQPAAVSPAADSNTAAAAGASQPDANTLVWTFNGKRIQAADAVFAEITPATPNSFATDTFLSVALSADPNICAQLADPNSFPNMLLISIRHPQALPSAQSANFIVSQASDVAPSDTTTTASYGASAEYSVLLSATGPVGLPRYSAPQTATYVNGSGQATYQPGSVTMTSTAADPNSLTLVVHATASTTSVLQDGAALSVTTDTLQGSIVAKRCPNLNVGIDLASESAIPFSPKWAGRAGATTN